jgi:phosphate transport system ATP-binding protein
VRISVENLTKRFGPLAVVSEVSLSIEEGELFTLLGPSGCGKTTLLKSCNRLIDLTDGVKLGGEVLIDGANILDPSVDVMQLRRKMGLLSQKPYPLPMSIYENVAYGPRIHGLRDRRKLDRIVEQCLQAASLWGEVKDRLRAPAAKLSVGQQQRLCLARALAVDPEVLLADEPTSALDPQSAQLVEKRLTELKGKYTILIVTHILRQAKRLADYVLFMYLGELIEHGPAQEVFTNPRHERTRAYVGGEVS